MSGQLKIKIIGIKGSFVDFKYLSSNSKSRIKKDVFLQDYDRGIYHVTNPDLLESLVGAGKAEATD